MTSNPRRLPARHARNLSLAIVAMLPFVAHAQLNVSTVYRQLSAGICGGSTVSLGGFGQRPGYAAVDQGADLRQERSAECNGVNVTSVADQSAVVGPNGIAVTSQYDVAFSGTPRNPYPAGQTPPIQDQMLAASKAVSGRASSQVHVDFTLSERTEFRVTGSTSAIQAASLFDAQENEYLLEAVFSQPRWTLNGATLILGPGQYTFDFLGGAGLGLGYFEGFSGASSVSKSFSISLQAVPEPGTWALMALGLAGVGLAQRRRTSA